MSLYFQRTAVPSVAPAFRTSQKILVRIRGSESRAPNDALQRIKRRHPSYVRVLYKKGSRAIMRPRLCAAVHCGGRAHLFLFERASPLNSLFAGRTSMSMGPR
jgi:hypothetical protein